MVSEDFETWASQDTIALDLRKNSEGIYTHTVTRLMHLAYQAGRESIVHGMVPYVYFYEAADRTMSSKDLAKWKNSPEEPELREFWESQTKLYKLPEV